MSDVDWPLHPAAAIFPELSDAEAADLAADIEAKGQLEEIRIYEGQLLDGRHRLAACKSLGIEPRWRDVTDDTDDPWLYAASLNLRRRHLSRDAATVLAVRIHRAREEAYPELAATSGRTRDTIAEEIREAGLRVAPRTVQKAITLIDKWPEREAAVLRGDITLNRADREARAEEEHGPTVGFRVTRRATLAALEVVVEAWAPLMAANVLASPCAGEGAIPRLVAELRAQAGARLPAAWYCRDTQRLPRPDDAEDWVGDGGSVLWESGVDVVADSVIREDVELVVENLPWGKHAPEPGKIIESLWHCYPHAGVLVLYDFSFWAQELSRRPFLRQHGPDLIVPLGRGAGVQTFGTEKNDLRALCAWLYWAPGSRGFSTSEVRWHDFRDDWQRGEPVKEEEEEEEGEDTEESP